MDFIIHKLHLCCFKTALQICGGNIWKLETVEKLPNALRVSAVFTIPIELEILQMYEYKIEGT